MVVPDVLATNPQGRQSFLQTTQGDGLHRFEKKTDKTYLEGVAPILGRGKHNQGTTVYSNNFYTYYEWLGEGIKRDGGTKPTASRVAQLTTVTR